MGQSVVLAGWYGFHFIHRTYRRQLSRIVPVILQPGKSIERHFPGRSPGFCTAQSFDGIAVYTYSIVLIIGTIVVFNQVQYAKNRPIGYNINALMVVTPAN